MTDSLFFLTLAAKDVADSSGTQPTDPIKPPQASFTVSSDNVCCSCLPVIATPGGGEHR
ncbi:MAG: hypothetical protein ABEH88_06740 [Halobacteriales archaeon]